MNPPLGLPTIHRALGQHGPTTSLALADLLNIPPKRVSVFLAQLAVRGGCEAIDRLPHPTLATHRLNLWRALPWAAPPTRKPTRPYHHGITPEDLQWMARYRQQAAARQARQQTLGARL